MAYAPHRRNYGADHRRWRAAILALYPICNTLGCNKPSTDADHITPLAKGGHPYDLNNGQGLCRAHHMHKTATIDSKLASRKRAPEKHPGVIG